ncbi:class I SAM-dependent methyltransferase [Proteiniborus sp. MB09-C3]|uniref:tRNA (mnm(5)s(2)U34)-methyltransferase n=1 Tax=Proteiniborus sp. MB09-C3 TaxID=3050072 RepID=UPI0025549E52|nr:class I SAM-dependent methyltransferase [Proteiniborus sp. MB09-C3]WIV10962.1 class I SAM-dependent methyltransferase [Proteiniborus sp. MB09-C3]
MYKYFNNVVSIAKALMIKRISKGNIVVDATVGNGNDTLLLAQLVGEEGKVYGFDIQESAINNTNLKLIENNFNESVYLIKDSHENIDQYVVDKADLIVFNLGYLPGGSHDIVTKAETTVIALEKSLDLLKENGLLLVTTYVGHNEGKTEDRQINKYFSVIDQKKFNVLKFEFINQINYPPVLYCVEKNKL